MICPWELDEIYPVRIPWSERDLETIQAKNCGISHQRKTSVISWQIKNQQIRMRRKWIGKCSNRFIPSVSLCWDSWQTTMVMILARDRARVHIRHVLLYYQLGRNHLTWLAVSNDKYLPNFMLISRIRRNTRPIFRAWIIHIKSQTRFFRSLLMDCHHLTIMDGLRNISRTTTHGPMVGTVLGKEAHFGSSTKEKQTPNIENHWFAKYVINISIYIYNRLYNILPWCMDLWWFVHV